MMEFNSVFYKEIIDFLAIRKVSVAKNTYDHDHHYLIKFDSYLVKNSVLTKEISEDSIIAWMSLLQGKSSSIAGEVIVIRIFLKYLSSIEINVFIPPVPKVSADYSPYIFTNDELSHIFQFADNIKMTGSQPNPYIQLEYPMMLRMLYGCGLRVGETLALQMKHLDLRGGILTLVVTKRNKERLIPMKPSLTEVLLKYCLAMGLVGESQRYLFPTINELEHLSKKAALHRFEYTLKNTGITLPNRKKHERGPYLHCLRHVFALKSFINAEKAGRRIDDSIPYLSIYLEHSSLQGTEQYLRFSSELFPDSAEMFEEYTVGIFLEVDYEK